MLFKLNMDILHPANRSTDSLTTCRSVQRSSNDRGHYDINCNSENFSESTLNKNLVNYGSFPATMQEQRKLGKFFKFLDFKLGMIIPDTVGYNV